MRKLGSLEVSALGSVEVSFAVWKEGWQFGRLAVWKVGRLEGWKVGRLEG